jgi:hypothetical protein
MTSNIDSTKAARLLSPLSFMKTGALAAIQSACAPSGDQSSINAAAQSNRAGKSLSERLLQLNRPGIFILRPTDFHRRKSDR